MGNAQKILGGHSLRLRAIAFALRGPPLQLGVRDCRGALWAPAIPPPGSSVHVVRAWPAMV